MLLLCLASPNLVQLELAADFWAPVEGAVQLDDTIPQHADFIKHCPIISAVPDVEL